MDDTASSFKIKLESTGNYRYSISPPPKNNNVEARLDHLISSRINKFDQGGARGGAIVVPNPRFESAKSQHFLSKIVTYDVHILPVNN